MICKDSSLPAAFKFPVPNAIASLTPPAADRPLREAMLAALVLNAVMMACAASLFSVPVLAPAIAADLGVDTTWVGTYSAIHWIASLVTSFAAGKVISRFGAIGVSQICLVLCGLGLVSGGMGMLSTFASSAILIGFAHGIETPASSQLLARLSPLKDQPLVFSLKQTGVQLGGIVSGVLFPFLLVQIGWRLAMWGVAAALFIGAFALNRARTRFDTEPPITSGRASGSMWQAVVAAWRDIQLRRMTLAALAFVSAQVCFNAFLVSFLVDERRLSLVGAGSVLAVGQFGGLIGRIIWGVISGRYVPPHTLLMGLGIVMTIGLAVLGGFGVSLPMIALLALSFVVGVSVSGWNGVFLAEIARLAPPGEVGRITGATFAISGTGLVMGPIAFGLIAAGTDFATAFVASAFWTLAGIVFLAWPINPAKTGDSGPL
jgi:MFS family permease